MQIHSFPFLRQQRIFVALTASGLVVAQYQRGFVRWKCINHASIALTETAQDFTEILSKLKEATSAWGVLAGTWASWIMPSDILAVVRYSKPSHSVSNISSLFPFDMGDLKVSEFNENSDTPQTIYWTHKDWLNEVVKVSSQLGWTCDEFYSRAQLFQSLLPKGPRGPKLLLEGDAENTYLHIYAADGAVERTTKIAMSRPEDLATALRREIAATSVASAVGLQLLACNVSPQSLQVVRAQYDLQPLPDVDFGGLVVRLIGSMQMGIEIHPTHGALVNRINGYSLAFAVAGSALLALMVWHDGVLQAEIESSRRQVRKDTPNYQAAKAMRLETVKMSVAVQVKSAIAETAPVFKPLGELLPALMPPASLLFYQQKAQAVRIAGTKGRPAAVKALLEKNPSFSAVRIAEPPDFLKARDGAFGLEMQWQEPGFTAGPPQGETLPLGGQGPAQRRSVGASSPGPKENDSQKAPQ